MSSSPINFTPIGVIKTEFEETVGMPIQPQFGLDHIGRVELYPKYQEGLKDLENISHVYLIYHFDRHHDFALRVKSYLDDVEHGVFSTRAPKRPNGVGISIVEIVSIKGSQIHFRGVDMLNDTPLLDIKPYFAEFDRIDGTKSGWLSHASLDGKGRADERFR